MNRHYKLFTLLLISGIAAIDDTESWSSISLETKTPYFSKIKIEQSLRLKNEAQNFKQTFTEVSLYYKFNDYITFNVPYRYAIFEDKVKSRISFGSALKYKKKDLTIRYRTKLENSKELNKEVEKTYRNKISLQFKLNKTYRPFISYEAFNIYDKILQNKDEDRYSLGIVVQVFKKTALKVYYAYKREGLSKKHAEYFGVLGLDYSVEL